MALDPVVNFFRSTIATLPVASGGTSIVITTGDGAKLPDPAVDGAFNLTIYNEDDPFDAPEIVRVTAIAGDTLTVTRAQEGTSATNKTSGNTWYLELTPTAKTIQDIDTAKLDVADVVNNLTSTDTDKALSANQGKVLQDGKLNLSGGTMTGDLTIPDKIIHAGDTNTAIRFPANDTFAIETGGVERVKVTSAGVSTSSDYIFSGTNNYLFSTDGVNGLTGINVASSANFVALLTTNTERMRITSTGNVGIGTTTPATKLDVNGNARVITTTGTASPTPTDLTIATLSNASDWSFTEPWGRLVFFNSDGSGGGGKPHVTLEAVASNAIGASSQFKIKTTSESTNTLTDRLVISNNGDIGLSTPYTAGIRLDVSGSIRSSTGILFGTDTAAANTLDDYEEGTFTPVLTGSTSGTFNGDGFYVKVGGIVYVGMQFNFISTANKPIGDYTITGMPFTSKATTPDSNVFNIGSMARVTFDSAKILSVSLGANSTVLSLNEQVTNDLGTAVTDSNFVNASPMFFRVNGTYISV